MASLPPANTEIATHRDLTRAVDRFEANLRRHIWRVVVGTGVVLYIALTGTLTALTALLLLVIDR